VTRIHRQSDSRDPDIRAHGCGAVSGVNALELMSGGAWRSDDFTASANVRVERSGVTQALFRKRGLTSVELAKSMHSVQASDERMDVDVQHRRGVDVKGALLPQLASAHAGALVAVLYGVVQDANKGVGSFRGGHWVFVYGPDLAAGTVKVADPLRRETTTWSVNLLADAMDRFGDKRPAGADDSWNEGRGEAIVVWPWLDWRQGYKVVDAKLDIARNALTAAKRQVTVLQAKLDACELAGPGPEALAAARAGGIADAAAAAKAVQ
jgi:hypothetical protein